MNVKISIETTFKRVLVGNRMDMFGSSKLGMLLLNFVN